MVSYAAEDAQQLLAEHNERWPRLAHIVIATYDRTVEFNAESIAMHVSATDRIADERMDHPPIRINCRIIDDMILQGERSAKYRLIRLIQELATPALLVLQARALLNGPVPAKPEYIVSDSDRSIWYSGSGWHSGSGISCINVGIYGRNAVFGSSGPWYKTTT